MAPPPPQWQCWALGVAKSLVWHCMGRITGPACLESQLYHFTNEALCFSTSTPTARTCCTCVSSSAWRSLWRRSCSSWEQMNTDASPSASFPAAAANWWVSWRKRSCCKRRGSCRWGCRLMTWYCCSRQAVIIVWEVSAGSAFWWGSCLKWTWTVVCSRDQD